MAEQALIWYGDGLQALFYDESNIKENMQGIKVLPLLVVPSQEIINKYKLDEEDLNIETDDGRKGLWMEYPHLQVTWLNRSKINAVIFIDCDFKGNDTRFMDRYDELLQYHRQRDKIEGRLRAIISAQDTELRNILADMPEYIRKQKEISDLYGKGEKMMED